MHSLLRNYFYIGPLSSHCYINKILGRDSLNYTRERRQKFQNRVVFLTQFGLVNDCSLQQNLGNCVHEIRAVGANFKWANSVKY